MKKATWIFVIVSSLFLMFYVPYAMADGHFTWIEIGVVILNIVSISANFAVLGSQKKT